MLQVISLKAINEMTISLGVIIDHLTTLKKEN